uniref:Uncharacterized protein n=1 Tax=Rhizophora mucronata TaxID=61149 RepID=A0A2P2K4W1_RHIMU
MEKITEEDPAFFMMILMLASSTSVLGLY